jgi:hypothetical protein
MIVTFFTKKNTEDDDIFITQGHKDIKLTRVDRPVSEQLRTHMKSNPHTLFFWF